MRFKRLISVFLTSILLTGCNFFSFPQDDDGDEVYITSISLNMHSIEMNVNESKLIKCTVSPTDATEQYTWGFTDETVASASKDGEDLLITGLKEGTTRLYVFASDEKVSDYCDIVINDGQSETIYITSISMWNNSTEINVDTSILIGYTVEPSNATEQVYLSVSDSEVISASFEEGESKVLITALAPGNATLYVFSASGDVSDYCDITVSSGEEEFVALTYLGIQNGSLELEVGESCLVDCLVLPNNANEDVEWAVTTEDVISYTSYTKYSCYITGLAIGTTRLYVFGTVTEILDYITVTVIEGQGGGEEEIDSHLVDDPTNPILQSSDDYEDSYYSNTVSKATLGLGKTSYYSTFDTASNGSNYYSIYRYAISGDDIILRSVNSQYNPAALYNIDTIYGIAILELTYSCSSLFTISFGIGSNNYQSTITVLPSISQVTVKIYLSNHSYSFYRITGNSSADLSISSVVVKRTSQSVTTDNNPKAISEPARQIISNNYSPNNGDKVTISGKTYTYYSNDYVYDLYESSPSTFDASKYAYTSAIDVANYYVAFNAWPANFFPRKTSDINHYCYTASSYKTISFGNEAFGDLARCIFEYSRTDGYAATVPYAGYTPRYYELDLDVDSTYSTSSRGVGRVVVFTEGGFSCYSDNLNVALFTDDHYETFKEYLNNGNTSEAFDSSESNMKYTNKVYWY